MIARPKPAAAPMPPSVQSKSPAAATTTVTGWLWAAAAASMVSGERPSKAPAVALVVSSPAKSARTPRREAFRVSVRVVIVLPFLRAARCGLDAVDDAVRSLQGGRNRQTVGKRCAPVLGSAR